MHILSDSDWQGKSTALVKGMCKFWNREIIILEEFYREFLSLICCVKQ